MTKTRWDLRIDAKLAAQIDKKSLELGLTRTLLVEQGLRGMLGEHPAVPEVQQRRPLPRPTAGRRQHLPTCRCPVCKPPK